MISHGLQAEDVRAESGSSGGQGGCEGGPSGDELHASRKFILCDNPRPAMLRVY